jgi:H/ACA ribonucleoprotein complex subunit 2
LPLAILQFYTMSKDKSEKRDKKEKKEKRSESDGVKKPKKDKKSKLNVDNITAAFEEATKDVEAPVVETKALAVTESSGEAVAKPVGALVPFANPLADDKVAKKVLKSVKKGSYCTASVKSDIFIKLMI